MTSMRLLLVACALQLQRGAAQIHDHHQQQHTQSAKSPWLLHDPGFPVDVRVSPFGDELWTETHIKVQDALPVLRLPSSLLNITVLLPARRNLTDVHVSISLFKPSREPQHQQQLSGEPDEFTVLADTQVQYASSYRIDVSHVADEIVLRVYVEGSVGRLADGDGDASATRVRARAFFVRVIDLTPSEAQYHICNSDSEQQPQEQEHHSIPPVNMPRHLCQQYTMGGKVPVRKWYFDDQSDADQSYAPRSFAFIEALIAKAMRRESFYYGMTDEFLFAALEKHGIRHQHVLIVGSTTPWYESVCVALEAASCTTIDYNRLRYDHPQLRTLTLAEFAATSSSDARKHFDAILSISTFEHDGLGRYGDPLAPDADLEAMKSLLQYAHPTGSKDKRTKLFLAVPVGADCVVWNAQRIYGPLRLPLLVQSWNLIDRFVCLCKLVWACCCVHKCCLLTCWL